MCILTKNLSETDVGTEAWGENHKWLETQNGAAKKLVVPLVS